MPTETTKRQARATKNQAEATKNQARQTAATARSQARKTAKPVEDQAEQTVRAAQKTLERAERTVTTVLVDSAYAGLGATDAAVAFVRSLPKTVRVNVEGGSLWNAVEREFDELAIRGRKVVDAIATSPATQRAVEQSKAARNQFRTAAGQLRRTGEDAAQAADDAVHAVEAAADEVGAPSKAAKEIDVNVDVDRDEIKVDARRK